MEHTDRLTEAERAAIAARCRSRSSTWEQMPDPLKSLLLWLLAGLISIVVNTVVWGFWLN